MLVFQKAREIKQSETVGVINKPYEACGKSIKRFRILKTALHMSSSKTIFKYTISNIF